MPAPPDVALPRGSRARVIAEGASPAISPDGNSILLLRGGDLYRYSASRRNEQVDDPLFDIRGGFQSAGWSPDGSKISFVSIRNGHNFVGVYDVVNETIRWMGPSVYRDMHPAWSPDSAQIAFMRRPGRLNGERTHLMTSWPFSIMVADVETGAAQEVWRSPTDHAGGLAQRYFPQPLYWTKTGRLVFYSEDFGFMQVFSITPDGEDIRALTFDNCEAEDTSLTPDGATLVFSHNCQDIDRRHLASAPVAGGGISILTKGDGIETHPVALSDRMIAFRQGGPTSPTRIALMNEGETSFVSDAPPDAFPGAALVTPQQAIFESTDGFAVHGQLFTPPDAEDDETFPALIFMHGGPIRQMLLGWHYRGYYANAYAMNQYLASQGYVVLAVNFRAGIGYGQKFRLVPDHGPRGASEYNDILAAAEFLKTLPVVDDDKIGLWGGSYGGLLTAQGLARNSDIFAAGVDLHGVQDVETLEAALRRVHAGMSRRPARRPRAPVHLEVEVAGEDDVVRALNRVRAELQAPGPAEGALRGDEGVPEPAVPQGLTHVQVVLSRLCAL